MHLKYSTDNLIVLDPDKSSFANIERSVLETHRHRGTLVQFESALIEKKKLASQMSFQCSPCACVMLNGDINWTDEQVLTRV
jgi:hypothetical protein